MYNIIELLYTDKDKEWTIKEIDENLTCGLRTIQRQIQAEAIKTMPRFDTLKCNGGISKGWRVKINPYGIKLMELKLQDDLKKEQRVKEYIERHTQQKTKEDTHLEQIEEYFSKYRYDESIESIEKTSKIYINMANLEVCFSELYDLAIDEPNNFIDLATKAANNVFAEYGDKITIKITALNDRDLVDLSHAIRVESLCRLVMFDGLILRATQPHPKITLQIYKCGACGEHIYVTSDPVDKYIQRPTECNCGNKKTLTEFTTKYIDIQHLVLQEVEYTQNPHRVTVVLLSELCEEINPFNRKLAAGNVVRIYGVPRPIKTIKNKQHLTKADIMIECLNYEVNKSYMDMKLTDDDIKSIKKLAKRTTLEDDITNSIAPHIYGHDDVKQGIGLQLFGGVKSANTRGDIHILLIGDPSTAKTQILRNVSKNILPRSVRSSGTGATGVGLTASVRKDAQLQEWVLEAGALVLANKSTCVIDELDKVRSEDIPKLNDAMESQEFPINKAGINTVLKTECSVLAAANPIHDTFDKTEAILPQINITDTTFSRFDLKYVIKDTINKDIDAKISDIIFDNHERGGVVKPVIDYELMRKYIAYAKRINPLFTDEARKIIQDAYVKLRGVSTESKYMIKTREMDTMIRLAESSARQHLSDQVTKQDAVRAVELLFSCVRNLCEGDVSIEAYNTGIRKELPRDTILRIISDADLDNEGLVDVDFVVDEAQNNRISAEATATILSKLMAEGIIFSPRTRKLQLINPIKKEKEDRSKKKDIRHTYVGFVSRIHAAIQEIKIDTKGRGFPIEVLIKYMSDKIDCSIEQATAWSNKAIEDKVIMITRNNEVVLC